MQYNSQTREDIFCIFKGFSCGSTSNLSRFIYDLVIYFIFLHVLQPWLKTGERTDAEENVFYVKIEIFLAFIITKTFMHDAF